MEFCKRFIRISSDEMCRFYDAWDNSDYTYRGYRILDRDDKDAIKDSEPPKIIVPVTYAQIQIAISFILGTYLQRKYFYELSTDVPEEQKYVIALETDINYQIVRQKFALKLYCYLLDIFKYGFGVIKTDWTKEYGRVRIKAPAPVNPMLAGLSKMFGAVFGGQKSTADQVSKILTYEGNRFFNVSPYAFFPDPSVTLANFQNGKFVGHDEETSMADTLRQEGDVYFGTDKIPATLPPEDLKDRKRRAGRIFGNDTINTSITPGPGDNKANRVDACVRTEVEFELTESQASERFKTDLGKGDAPCKWVAVYGNDQKLIRFEKAGYLHDQYNYCLAEFSPDHNSFYNPGLADTVYELQNIITFFLNSHIVNVRKIIQNRFIADESKIYKDDFTSNAMLIRLKNGGIPIDRIIKQLDVHDVTSQHVGDIETIYKILQIVTGINENAQGQYAQGRRSATESRNVNVGAGARLKLHAQIIWMQGLQELGRQVISNTRQGRTPDVYAKIVGALAREAPYDKVILADPNKLAGGYDFLPYDATLPSDKQRQAQVLMELFQMLISNPQSIQMLNKNPMPLLDHIAQLLDIRNLHDYDLNPEKPLQMPQAPSAQVVPDHVAQEVAAAGAQPVDMTGEGALRTLANGTE